MDVGEADVVPHLFGTQYTTKIYYILFSSDVMNLYAKNQNLRWILIDEISMVADALLGTFESCMDGASVHSKYSKRRDGSRVVMGGYNLLFFGDWWQLPPIPDSYALFLPTTKSKFKQHVASIHEGKKPFKCDICDHSCSHKGNMKTHVASVHKVKKSFKCDICGYSCSQKGNMNSHVADVHEGKKPFKCDICDYGCSQKEDITKHFASVHEGKKPFKCDICDYSCYQKSSLSK